MKNLENQIKMKRFLSVLTIVILVGIFSLYSVSASCVIQGNVKNSTGTLIGWDVRAYCLTDNSWRNTTGAAGESYLVSWGGPADNCQAFCDNVYITGTNATLSFTGYPTNETTLVYYYPMNSTTTSGWASGVAHAINITELGDVTAPVITIVSPTSLFYYSSASVWFNVTTSETASWCGYSLDSATNVSMGGSGTSWNTLNSSMTEGSHSVRFYCNDTSGNMGTAGPRTFYVDLTNPVASTNNPIEGSNWTSSQTVTFNLKCTDNLAVDKLVLYGNWSGWGVKQTSSATNNTWWNPTETIANGVYIWAAWCNDSSGRTNMTGNITFRVAYTAPGGGGGGGGGGSTCTVYQGTCFSGTACPNGYMLNSQGSCTGSEVCCKKSTDICALCLDFIKDYSMFSFSTLEFDNFYTTVSNQTNITKVELEDTIKNYNTKCGNYCLIFSWPVVGKYLEMAGRAISKDNACTVAVIIIILVVGGIFYYIYRRSKKRRFRR